MKKNSLVIPIVILFISLLSGYSWGMIIQQYRPLLRNPQEILYYFLEVLLHITVFFLLWLHRDYLLGRKYDLRKLIVLHTMLAVDLVHWFGYIVY